MEEDQVRTFLAELDYQAAEIERTYKILTEKSQRLSQGPPVSELIESAGYWLHNLYSACEDLFKLIVGFWENHITANGSYHLSLLKRMRVAIPDVRPEVLSEESFRHLDELRAFRHVFRHAYSYGLDDERVAVLLRKVLQFRGTVLGDLTRFREAIGRTAGGGTG